MSRTPKTRRLAVALTPSEASTTLVGSARLSLESKRTCLFLSTLLDALATGVERALASGLSGQLLASLLVYTAVSKPYLGYFVVFEVGVPARFFSR